MAWRERVSSYFVNTADGLSRMAEKLACYIKCMTTQSPRIFLSYSSKDHEFAWQMAADLEFAGAQVWLDRAQIQIFDDEPAPAKYDEYVAGELSTGIHDINYFILLLSKNALQADWVMWELEVALARSIQVLVLEYQHCERPDILRGIESFDFTSLKKYEVSLDKLCRFTDLCACNLKPIGPLSGYWDYLSSEKDVADGRLVMHQRGSLISGRVDYESGNSGRIVGENRKGKVIYRWRNSLERGIGLLNYDAKEDTLKGYYIRGDKGPKIAWTLRRGTSIYYASRFK